jgi:hypothetical protein
LQNAEHTLLEQYPILIVEKVRWKLEAKIKHKY